MQTRGVLDQITASLAGAGSGPEHVFATGYSMLGMTVSPPAGEAMAEMIVTGSRPDVFEPFRVDRFPR